MLRAAAGGNASFDIRALMRQLLFHTLLAAIPAQCDAHIARTHMREIYLYILSSTEQTACRRLFVVRIKKKLHASFIGHPHLSTAAAFCMTHFKNETNNGVLFCILCCKVL